jgi:alpha-L-fucosidase
MAQPAGPAPASQDAKMQWFREAKFGLFIHWGLYAIPAGEWKGQPIAGIGELIINRAKIPAVEYAELAKEFNPVKFDADAWVQMAQVAGMKYLVITSKHHDGFAMYRSLVSAYNVYDATPWHRDPLKELSAACARHGIRFGFYYSQAQDWHEPNGAGNDWDFGPDNKKDFDQYLRGKAEPQVKELLTSYGPICLIWFDTPRMMNGDRGRRFIDIVHSMQPATLIDGRLGSAGDYRSMGGNSIPNAVVEGDWEVPATINHTWGFKKDDTDWKSPADITFKLVDIASKGGNYLLNVGPTSEGIIPQPARIICALWGVGSKSTANPYMARASRRSAMSLAPPIAVDWIRMASPSSLRPPLGVAPPGRARSTFTCSNGRANRSRSPRRVAR